MSENDEPLAGDILEGAEQIALFMFGDEKRARRIYSLTEKERRKLGLFNLGKEICGRRSTIRRRIAEREGETGC